MLEEVRECDKMAHEEERLIKKRALELYDKKILDSFEVGTFAVLKEIIYLQWNEAQFGTRKLRLCSAGL